MADCGSARFLAGSLPVFAYFTRLRCEQLQELISTGCSDSTIRVHTSSYSTYTRSHHLADDECASGVRCGDLFECRDSAHATICNARVCKYIHSHRVLYEEWYCEVLPQCPMSGEAGGKRRRKNSKGLFPAKRGARICSNLQAWSL